jgi:hypothetical protein
MSRLIPAPSRTKPECCPEGLERTGPAGGGPLPITASRKGHLVDALEHAYRCLGSRTPPRGRGVRQLVLARIIEPVSTSWTAFGRWRKQALCS